jgi:predicted CXXCH cytochrome family protein
MRTGVFVAIAFAALSPLVRAQAPHTDAGYVDPKVCAGCHASIWETYRRTGMARSFYRPSPESAVEDFTNKNAYYHRPSDTYFTMIQRDGRYFQRQHQIGFDGAETNVVEKSIDFVLGSGNHSRTYLHRTATNTLVELPLAWYAEKGGYWAMNPGYDRPDHQGFRRAVGFDCMFCHNSYPEIASGSGELGSDPVFSNLPEGIDCQRCHGPGGKHAELAKSAGSRAEDIRNSIVNPSRLTAERQMEVCMQCHLETTSFPLPNSIVRYEREPFSYRPGEPLSDFMLHFDQAPGTGHDDKFEIVSSAYRLRQSACFLKSGGALRCTTCHNPHDAPRAEEAARHYAAVCRECHAAPFNRLVSAGKHSSSGDCVGCHMPKRRTDDVVHVVMTDHYIQRRKPTRDLESDIAEKLQNEATAYRGEVVLYYPRSLKKPEDELYLAVAQVSQTSNLSAGIARLSAAIDKYRPQRADYYLRLGDAWRANGKPDQAIPVYQEALRRKPDSVPALQDLALCFFSLGQQANAAGMLQRALDITAANAVTWHLLGTVYVQQNRTPDAIAAFQKAIDADPDIPDGYNSLGGILLETGDRSRAERLLRQAIRIQPNHAQAHNNLGNLLSETDRFEDARYHFEAAIRFKENYNGARYNYALALARVHRMDEAQSQVEAILRTDPNAAEAHEFLGNLLVSKGQLGSAIAQYREAVRIVPEFSRARLDLGATLIKSGDLAGALPYLRQAAQSPDAAIREEAQALLRKYDKAR